MQRRNTAPQIPFACAAFTERVEWMAAMIGIPLLESHLATAAPKFAWSKAEIATAGRTLRKYAANRGIARRTRRGLEIDHADSRIQFCQKLPLRLDQDHIDQAAARRQRIG